MKNFPVHRKLKDYHIEHLGAETKTTEQGYKYERINYNVRTKKHTAHSSRFYFNQKGVMFKFIYTNTKNDFDDQFIERILNDAHFSSQ